MLLIAFSKIFYHLKCPCLNKKTKNKIILLLSSGFLTKPDKHHIIIWYVHYLSRNSKYINLSRKYKVVVVYSLDSPLSRWKKVGCDILKARKHVGKWAISRISYHVQGHFSQIWFKIRFIWLLLFVLICPTQFLAQI